MSPTDAMRGSSGIAASTPLRVFLSHTSDLGKHTESGTFVAAAVEAVLRARHAVTDMAYFAARDTSPTTMCIDMVARSDVYVGIVGLRYGSPVLDRPEVSYTELEFEAAGEHCQPRLIFLVREDSRELARKRQPAGHRARQDAFRCRLRDSGLTVVQITTPAELELAVYQALVELSPGLADAQALLASMPADALPERGPLPAGSRMPLAPNPLFVGRGDELLQVAGALRGGNTTVAFGQVVASTGLGGLGKTQLAVELVHRYGRYFAGGVFWLSFASADEIPLQVAACAAAEFESRRLEERVQRVKDVWQSAVPRLLVFDNCEEEALLDAWRPPSGGCRVLVTSRRSTWSPTLGVTALPLDLLPRADSIELLRRYRPDLAADDPGLDAIATEVGDLPLALHLAGSYLRAYRAGVSLDGYLAELRRSDVVQHASLLGAGLDDSPSPTRHVQSVAQTFALCLGRLDWTHDVDRVAIAVLARMACMAPGEPVPRDLLAKTLEEVDPRLRADGLRRLSAVGLVEESEGWLRLHRLLVHFVRQQCLDPDAQQAVALALTGCGQAVREYRLTGQALEAAIPHMVHVASRETGDVLRLAGFSDTLGMALMRAGDLRTAKWWLQRALVIREEILCPNHPDTATSLNILACVLQYQGELIAAKALFERAVAIRRLVLGPDHADTATSYNNLGWLLRDLDHPLAALEWLRRAHDIWDRTLGSDHPATMQALRSIGVLLHDLGDLVAARSCLEQALAAHAATLGFDDPRTAWSLCNLGWLLRDLEAPDAAMSYLGRSLEIMERVMGPDHPDTAWALTGVGVLLHEKGHVTAAGTALRRGLAIRERVLGAGHPHVAFSLNCMALLLRDQGNAAAARPLFERALAIREHALGSDHPDSVATRRALAELVDGPPADR